MMRRIHDVINLISPLILLFILECDEKSNVYADLENIKKKSENKIQ